MKNWYCKPANEAEAIEIVKRAVANGAKPDEVVMGGEINGSKSCTWNGYRAWGVYDKSTVTHAHGCGYNMGEQLTIEQVREQFLLPGEAKQQSTWQGPQDGLPPVGTVCEAYLLDGADPEECTIIGINETQIVVKWKHFNNGGFDILFSKSWQFRPLRTEREVWVETAADAVRGTDVALTNKLIFELCAAIYDAGLAKEV